MILNKFKSIILILFILFSSGYFNDTIAINPERFDNDKSVNKLTDNSYREKEIFSRDRVTAFRIRADFNSDLDEDFGWGAAINEAPTQTVDSPFRIRFEVESDTTTNRRQYSLQYRRNNGPWQYLEAHDFPYPSAASPSMSIMGCEAFFYGEEADDLIAISNLPDDTGAGICLSPTTPGWIPG